MEQVAMKYSLRSLMIVVTLVAVLLGGRIEFLRRMAAFHEQQASEPEDELSVRPNKQELMQQVAGRSKRIRHRKIAANYRAACFRPWIFVNESVDVSHEEATMEILFGPPPHEIP